MKLHLMSILFLLLILSCGNLNAQLQGQPLIDSLLKELPKAKEDSNKVKLLNEVSNTYKYINPDEGVKYGQQGLGLATKLDWKKGIAYAENCIGYNYHVKSDDAKALEFDFKAIKIFEEIGEKAGTALTNKNIGIIYEDGGEFPNAFKYYSIALKIDEEIGNKSGAANDGGNLASIYLHQGQFPKALECYFKALKLCEETGNKNGVAAATCNIGIVYKDEREYAKALEYFLKALKMDEEIGNKQFIMIVTTNIGIVYLELKDYQKAQEYFFKELRIAEEIGDKHMISGTLAAISGVYGDQKDYEKALDYELRALKIFMEIEEKSSIAFSLGNIGRIYLGMASDTTAHSNPQKYTPSPTIPNGKTALLHKAIEYLQQGIELSKELKMPDVLLDDYNTLALAYKLNGDYKNALECSDNYHAINDTLFSRENDKKIVQQGMKNEYDKKEAVAAVKQEKKDAVQRNVRNSISVGLLGTMAFSVVIFRQRNKVKKEKAKVEKEKARSEELLLNILPEEVAEELKAKGSAEAKMIDEVTVIFTDFKGFTQLSEKLSPETLVAEINECFSAFDHIMQKYGVEKIKTIGDSYMAAGGLPTPNKTHPVDVVKAALDIQEYMQDHKKRKEAAGELFFEIRIGIHSGSVVAGIVGVKKFAYDIWGDTVNTAARMEQNSEAGKINISQTTYDLVKDKISCEYRGEIDAKGKGQLKMYYVG